MGLVILKNKHISLILFSYSWGYRKVYDQFSYAIQQKYPDLIVLGDNYPPPIERAFFAQVFGIGKLILIGLVIGGQNPFGWFGMNTPDVWSWAIDNKVRNRDYFSFWRTWSNSDETSISG